MKVSEPFHGGGEVHTGVDEPHLFGSVRISGPDPEGRSYFSMASFSDPDGNGWVLQEVTARLPGRVAGDTTFTSAAELAAALRRAAVAHGEHEKRTGSTISIGRTGTPSMSSTSRLARRCRNRPATVSI